MGTSRKYNVSVIDSNNNPNVNHKTNKSKTIFMQMFFTCFKKKEKVSHLSFWQDFFFKLEL